MRTRRSPLAVRPLEDRTAPAAGLMDPTFGGDGIVTFGLAGFYASQATGVAVQPDGKTVLVGAVDSPTASHGTVFRLTADGSPDPTFGGGDGIVTVQLNTWATNFTAVALQPDGKIVATGSVRKPGFQYTIVTARFLPDGTLDPAFNGTGYVITDFSAAEEGGYNLALQPDGKIVVLGNGDGLLLFRYTAAGVLDPTFNLDGIFRHQPGGYGASGRGVAVQADGKIVAAGQGVPAGSPERGFLLLRVTPDGNLDPTFDGDGLVHTQIPGGGDPGAYDVAALPDGRLIAVGGAVVGGYGQHAAARYLPTGALDPTFDGDGRVLLQYHPDHPGGGLQSVAVQPDGKAVAAGYVVFANESVVLRFGEDGRPDPAFGVGNYRLAPGVVFTNAEADDLVNDVVIAPDGRIVTAGKANNKNAVLRYTGETTAAADAYTTPEDTLRTVEAPGVLANDPTPNGSERVVTLLDGPDHAAGFTLNADGSFTYLPAPDYNGPDSFTYKFTAGTDESGPATVNLTVQPVNDAPTAAADDYDFPHTGPLVVPAASGLLANDDDPDGDGLEAVLVDGPPQGGLDLNADGSFTFTYPPAMTDSVTFTYRVTDGEVESDPVTVTLTRIPNQPPTAAADTYDFAYRGPLTVPAATGVLANDTDPDGGPLQAVLIDPPAQGSVALNGDGSFTFTYPEGLSGVLTFTYRVFDGEDESAPATVTLTRQPNQPPVAVVDNYQLPFAGPFAVSAAAGVLANDSDSEGNPITPTLVGPPAVGTLTFRPDGSFDYAFSPDLVGPVTFTYAVTDGTDPGNTTTVTLTREGHVVVSGSTLTVLGTGGLDAVRLRPVGAAVAVEMQTPLGLTTRTVRPAPGFKKFTAVSVLLGSGDDRLTAATLAVPVRAVGGAGADHLRTGRGKDTVFGDEADGSGTGADLIETGAGDDTITGGAGGSFIDAGSGNDLVRVSGGTNWLQGGTGNDVLTGGTGADFLEGGAGKDLLAGGSGADRLDGGAGGDLLFDGVVAPATPADSLTRILTEYVPTKRSARGLISARLAVSSDTGSADTLTGGAGTDWFWSSDALDVLDLAANEPKNAVA